jgi:hypothetical protein
MAAQRAHSAHFWHHSLIESMYQWAKSSRLRRARAVTGRNGAICSNEVNRSPQLRFNSSMLA